MSTPYAAGYSAGQLIIFLAFLLPAILFLRTQQNALLTIWPQNRRMHPGLVWLQLIPLFSYVWIFIVVKRIADSLSKQYAVLQSDSIFGIADEDAIKAMGKRPTYGIGLAYCLLLVSVPLVVIFFNLLTDPLPVSADRPETSGYYPAMAFLIVTLLLAAFVCWIIYWVQLAACKKKLRLFTE